MNIQSDKLYMVFRKEYDNKPYYKISISKKLQDGKYDNAYLDVEFTGGADIPNKTSIYLKESFLTYYKNKDNKTTWYLQIMKWELVEDVIKHSKENDIVKQNTKDEYKDLGNSVKLEDLDIDSDLPF